MASLNDLLKLSLGPSPTDSPSASLKFVPPTPAKTTTAAKPVTQAKTTGAVVNTGSVRPNATVAAPSAPSGPSESDLALQALNAAKQQAQDIRSEGQNTFNSLLGAVNAYRDRSKQQFTDAAQEIIDNASNILGTNANNAQQLVGKATGQARSLGLGLSSRLNSGQSLLNNLATTQGSTLATEGQNNRSNQVQLDTRNDTAQSNEDQANNYLKQINDAANQVESSGVNNYGTALNNIVNYQRSLAALTPLNSGSLTQLNPDFSSVANTLSSVLGGSTPTSTASAPGAVPANAGANPVDITSILDLLKKQQGLATQ